MRGSKVNVRFGSSSLSSDVTKIGSEKRKEKGPAGSSARDDTDRSTGFSTRGSTSVSEDGVVMISSGVNQVSFGESYSNLFCEGFCDMIYECFLQDVSVSVPTTYFRQNCSTVPMWLILLETAERFSKKILELPSSMHRFQSGQP